MRTLKDRVEEALAAGFKTVELARAAGVTPGAVSQWASGETKSLRGKSAIGLSALTGWEARWWAEGVGSREEKVTPSAPRLEVDGNTVSPQLLTWERVMELAGDDDLPDEFRVTLVDGAMAPEACLGWVVEFDRREAPRPGDGVLVQTSGGELFFRKFKQGRAGSWEAVPIAPDFLSLESERDGLVVIAVMRHVLRPRWG